MSHFNFTQRILIFASILIFGVFIFIGYLIAFNKTTLVKNSQSVSDSGLNSFVLDNNQIIKESIDLDKDIVLIKRTSFEIPQTGYLATNGANLNWSYEDNILNVKSGILYINNLRQINIQINDSDLITLLPESKVFMDADSNKLVVISGVAIQESNTANSFQSLNWLVDEYVVDEVTIDKIANDSNLLSIVYTLYDFDLLPSGLIDLSPSRFLK
jgi:hypothetical protein